MTFKRHTHHSARIYTFLVTPSEYHFIYSSTGTFLRRRSGFFPQCYFRVPFPIPGTHHLVHVAWGHVRLPVLHHSGGVHGWHVFLIVSRRHFCAVSTGF